MARHRAVARARSSNGAALDNGQHILIGAYTRDPGADARRWASTPTRCSAVARSTLTLPRRPRPAAARGPAVPGLRCARVLALPGLAAGRERLSLLRPRPVGRCAAFAATPALTVAQLCRPCPTACARLLVDPLCVAALNTPAREASATVFLRVLRDALFGGRGSADLLLPRRSLGALLPGPAAHWLHAAGADAAAGLARAAARTAPPAAGASTASASTPWCWPAARPKPRGWRADTAPDWAAAGRRRCATSRSSPSICDCPGARLPAPMTALVESDGARAVRLRPWRAGRHARAVWPSSSAARGPGSTPGWTPPVRPRCSRPAAPSPPAPGPRRRCCCACWPRSAPPSAARPACGARRCGWRRGSLAAGDYVDGPYPATLEGAVRSGEAAAALVRPDRRHARERRRQRFAHEQALLRPGHALPVGLDGGAALQVVQQQQLRVRKLLQVVAGFADRAVAGRGPGGDPLQHRALAVLAVSARRRPR